MTPEMLDALLSAGATADMIAAAWKAEMADRGSTMTERRAKDAERKRLARSRPQCPVESSGHDGTDADTADTGKSLDKEKSPTPPKEIKLSPPPAAGGDESSGDDAKPAEPAKPKPARRQARPQGERLPADWRPIRFSPDTTAREVADERGAAWGRTELEKFKAHWASSAEASAYKLDWQSAWIKWVLKAHKEDRGNGNGRSGSVAGNGRPSAFGKVVGDFLAESAANRDAGDG